jgi:hypothetical protein
MSVFSFSDVFDDGPPRTVLARVLINARELGGRDLPSGAIFRPNHNFGDESNRAFYIGQVQVPEDGQRAGETRVVTILFLNGEGLDQLLHVGRQWRLQSGPNLIGTAEVLEVK